MTEVTELEFVRRVLQLKSDEDLRTVLDAESRDDWGWCWLDELREQIAKVGATFLVNFKNMQLDSSHCGEGKPVLLGLNCTYKTVEEVTKGHLNDLPSLRMYPDFWCTLAVPGKVLQELAR